MTEVLGEGWTGETALGLAIYAFKHGKSFEHSIVISTNHRGDSDSTASMAGQLYAAFKELTNEDLEKYEYLDIKDIIDSCLENIEIINNFEIIKTENDNIEDQKEVSGALKLIRKLFRK